MGDNQHVYDRVAGAIVRLPAVTPGGMDDADAEYRASIVATPRGILANLPVVYGTPADWGAVVDRLRAANGKPTQTPFLWAPGSAAP